MNKEILLLGCNYNHINYRSIDYTSYIAKISRYVKKKDIIPIELSDVEDTTYNNILLALYKVALKSWTSNLSSVLIYYIGDSIDISEYISGYNSNYNINQGIVPTDYNIRKNNSVINNDLIYEILSQFNPSTKIIFIADTCFTKSNILNLKYDWDIENKQLKDLSSLKINDTLKNILVISLCLDKLSSNDDNFYNILDINKNIISLGDYIIKLRNLLDNKNEEKKTYDIFNILKDINGIISNKKINMRVSLSSSYNLLNEKEYLSILDKQEDILSLSTYDDYVKNSYVEIDNIDIFSELPELPTFIDVPLVQLVSNNNNEKAPIVPKVIKANIEPKVETKADQRADIPKLHFNKPPILIDQRNKLRTSNSNNEYTYQNIPSNRCSRSSFVESPREEYVFQNIPSNRCSRSSFVESPREEYVFQNIPSNRCSRSSFVESPREYIQQVVPIIPLVPVSRSIPLQQVQQLQQFIPQQRQVFIESPRIQYQHPIQNIYPIQPLQPLQPLQQYNNYPQKSYPQQYVPNYQQPQSTQNYILKSTIVPKDTRTYQNKYYEPSSTYVQECYC
jgi:hypothetical protein